MWSHALKGLTDVATMTSLAWGVSTFMYTAFALKSAERIELLSVFLLMYFGPSRGSIGQDPSWQIVTGSRSGKGQTDQRGTFGLDVLAGLADTWGATNSSERWDREYLNVLVCTSTVRCGRAPPDVASKNIGQEIWAPFFRSCQHSRVGQARGLLKACDKEQPFRGFQEWSRSLAIPAIQQTEEHVDQRFSRLSV